MSRQSTKYIDGVAIALTQSSAEVILAYFGCSGSSILEWNTTPAASAIWAIDQSMESEWSEVVSMGPKGISWCCHRRRQLVRCGQMQLERLHDRTWHILVLLHFVVQFSNVRKAKSQVLRRCLFATLKLFAGGWASASYIVSAPRPFEAGLDRLSAKEAGQSGQVYDILKWWMWERQWLLSICLLIGLSFWLKFNSWTAIFGFVCV